MKYKVTQLDSKQNKEQKSSENFSIRLFFVSAGPRLAGRSEATQCDDGLLANPAEGGVSDETICRWKVCGRDLERGRVRLCAWNRKQMRSLQFLFPLTPFPCKSFDHELKAEWLSFSSSS